MTTAARPQSESGSHWYYRDGSPCYELPCKSRPGEMRAVTLKDARAMNLLPSVTTILKCLHKEGLVQWRIEQACLSVLTAPKLPGEELDAFVTRVLQTEKQQEKESQVARDRGTEIHNAMEQLFKGNPIDPELEQWVMPAYNAIRQESGSAQAELILVGEGYAGKTDLIYTTADGYTIWDYKTAKKLPTGDAWPEHRMQLAAYAEAFRRGAGDTLPIRVANCYISTVEPGQFRLVEHNDWEGTYRNGFLPVLQHWYWSTGL